MKFQLQSLRAIQCGPLDDVCIHFNTNGESPVTILAGANGSGKTTTLECIMGIAQLLDPGIYAPVTIDRMLSGPEEVPVLHDMPACTYAQLNCLINDKPFCLYFGQAPDNIKLDGNRYGLAINPRRRSWREALGEVDRQVNAGILTQSEQLVSTLQDWAKNEDLEGNQIGIIPSLLYFPHERMIGQPNGNDRVWKEDIFYQWIYKFKTASNFPGSLDSYLIWLDYAEPKIFTDVIDFLNSLNFEGKTFGISRKELRAIVTTKDGQTHGLSKLSSGEQKILLMLLELRRRLLPYSIVLIDEIENSLHPAFQHKLARWLKVLQSTIPFQLIFTTHSTELLDVFGTSSVRILTTY